MLLSHSKSIVLEVHTPTSSLDRQCQRVQRLHSISALRRRLPPSRIASSSSSSASEPPSPASADTPKVGWLWDRKKGNAPTRQYLREQNIRPKKSLGQNFMVDDTVLAAITQAAALAPGDPVLEVGPGTGALTRHLLEAGASLTAVEKDYDLHDRLAAEFNEVPALRLICGDILRLNLPEVLEGTSAAAGDEAAQQKKVQVVANLPYYITKDFLVRALPEGGRASRLLLMLQDEVAVRLTQVVPGSADWRAMNIIVHYFSEPRYLFKIDRKKYVPAPKVNGAVVEFKLRPQGERAKVPDERTFLQLVKKAFLQRRKALRNALQPLYSSQTVATALQALELSADARAQELGLEGFVRLAWALEEVAKVPGDEQEEAGDEE